MDHYSRREFLTAAGALALALGDAGCAVPPANTPTLPPNQRCRLRELGFFRFASAPGPAPGTHNAITDVPGVRVGHTTLIQGDGPLVPGHGPVRTGVTAILPNGDVFRHPVRAAAFVFNGNGEMTGLLSVQRRGNLRTPILLTDTSNIGRVLSGAQAWMMRQYAEIGDTAPVPVPVVAETWAGFLHDAEGRHIQPEHIASALEQARGGPVAEGVVGGGTGMVCYEFKGGIGTSSRKLSAADGGFCVGILAQCNHGRRKQLRMDGVPVGLEIPDLMPVEGTLKAPPGPKKTKSIVLIGATDAPCSPLQLGRLCKRMALGLARTGSISMHGSGDLLLFFSTAKGGEAMPEPLWNDEQINPLLEAAVQGAEEAILNALCMANTVVGIQGNTVYGLPLDRLYDIFRKYGRV